MPVDPAIERILATLARQATLAILSNWPLAATVDRYAEAAGWLPHLRAIVISQRVGTIKPHPAIFAEARRQLGDPAPDTILHVGDDWAADVVGAVRAGWRAAYVTDRPHGLAAARERARRDGRAGPRDRLRGRSARRCSRPRRAHRRAIGHSPHWASVRVGGRMHRPRSG